MRPRLIVRLPAAPAQAPTWVLTDAQGRPEGSSVSGNAEGMAQAARGREVVALLPGMEVLLTRAVVPTQNRGRLARVVPYALEDQLTADVEKLHFGIGRADTEGAVTAAVVDRDYLRTTLDTLEADGLEVRQAYAETLAVPRHEDAWTLLLDGDGFLLRTGEQTGLAGDMENLELLLDAALQEAGEAAPPRLMVYHPPGRPPTLSASAPEPEFQVVADTTALLAGHLDARTAIALRTGSFASTPARQMLWQRWRVAAVMVLALVLFSTARGWAEQWRLQQEMAGLEARMHATFDSAFPGSGVPAGQEVTVLRNRLERLRGGGSGADTTGMLALLDRAAPVLSGSEGMSIQALGYRGDGLDMEVEAPSLQAMERLQQQLDAAGLSAEVQGARSEADAVRGRLRLETNP